MKAGHILKYYKSLLQESSILELYKYTLVKNQQ